MATTKAKATSRKATPRKAKAKQSDVILTSALYASHAARKGIDTTKAAKQVRGKLRANFAAVVEASPNVGEVKSAANDGNRWPTHMSRKVAEIIGVPVE